MNIQEFTAREIFKNHGIPVKNFGLARDVESAFEIARGLRFPVVLKAQVLVGGRGKAGGIKLANTLDEVQQKASDILRMELKGIKVKKLIVSEAVDIVDEYYVSISLDRMKKLPTLIFSKSGGVDIEETARISPEKIVKYDIDPFYGLKPFMARSIAFHVMDEPQKAIELASIMMKMYDIYRRYYANLVEINPLAIDLDGNFWAADAKMIIDDNATSVEPSL
ncbi:MAG: ATP-grasp domain-containing protein, partial [bacterium]